MYCFIRKKSATSLKNINIWTIERISCIWLKPCLINNYAYKHLTGVLIGEKLIEATQSYIYHMFKEIFRNTKNGIISWLASYKSRSLSTYFFYLRHNVPSVSVTDDVVVSQRAYKNLFPKKETINQGYFLKMSLSSQVCFPLEHEK